MEPYYCIEMCFTCGGGAARPGVLLQQATMNDTQVVRQLLTVVR